MAEYISFSEIDEFGAEPGQWTPEQIEAANFFHGLDWEGGISGLYGYGGAGEFPEEVRELAAAYGEAYERLHDAIEDWGKARGVVY